MAKGETEVGERERLERAVDSLREAQLDDSHWPEAAALVDEACGTLGNHLAVLRGSDAADAEFVFGNLYKRGEPDAELERLYVEDYLAIDERTPRYFRMANGHLCHQTSMFRDDELASSPTYNEFLVPTGAANATLAHMAGPDELHIVWALVASGDASRWTSERLATVRQLVPHARHYVAVRQALADARTGALQTATTALAAKRIGIVLLDRHGRIVEANDRARALLRAGDGLTDRSGALIPARGDDVGRLSGLLGTALGRALADSRGGSMPVHRAGLPPLTMHVTPLARGSALGTEMGAAALALIVDPLDKPRVDAERLAEALDLTPGQAHVAAALASGGTVQSIAARTHRTEATVRYHLKRLMAKLGLFSQTELVRLVLTTPGVFGD